MHLEPSEGHPQNGRRKPSWIRCFLREATGGFPVISITGVKGKTTVTRLIAHIMFVQGRRVGMTTTDGVNVIGRRIDKDECSGPKSARAHLG